MNPYEAPQTKANHNSWMDVVLFVTGVVTGLFVGVIAGFWFT